MRDHFRHSVPWAFQWYKELFNPMGFDPCNHFLKIQESIKTPTPKVGAHLGVWGFIPSHSPTFPGAWNVTPGLPSWRTPLQALALVVSPRLRLWQPLCEPTFLPLKPPKFKIRKVWCSCSYFGDDQLKCQMFNDAFSISRHFANCHKGRWWRWWC
jgi:hypothetical protein